MNSKGYGICIFYCSTFNGLLGIYFIKVKTSLYSGPLSGAILTRETRDIRGYLLDIRLSSVTESGYNSDIRRQIRDGCACTDFIMLSIRYPFCG